MQKALLLLLLFAACKSGSTQYVNHTEGQFSMADDTLIVEDTVIINRTGFQKIRDGIYQPKEYRVRQCGTNSVDAPVIRFDRNHAYWNNTIYRKLP